VQAIPSQHRWDPARYERRPAISGQRQAGRVWLSSLPVSGRGRDGPWWRDDSAVQARTGTVRAAVTVRTEVCNRRMLL
jgi:hypothetical protein